MVPDSRKRRKKNNDKEQLHLEQRRAYRVRGWGTGCDTGAVCGRFIATGNRAGQDGATGESGGAALEGRCWSSPWVLSNSV